LRSVTLLLLVKSSTVLVLLQRVLSQDQTLHKCNVVVGLNLVLLSPSVSLWWKHLVFSSSNKRKKSKERDHHRSLIAGENSFFRILSGSNKDLFVGLTNSPWILIHKETSVRKKKGKRKKWMSILLHEIVTGKGILISWRVQMIGERTSGRQHFSFDLSLTPFSRDWSTPTDPMNPYFQLMLSENIYLYVFNVHLIPWEVHLDLYRHFEILS
jgi:hypothetical protein